MNNKQCADNFVSLEKSLDILSINDVLYSKNTINTEVIDSIFKKHPFILKILKKFFIVESDLPKLILLKKMITSYSDILKKISPNYHSYETLNELLYAVIFITEHDITFSRYFSNKHDFIKTLNILNLKFSETDFGILVSIPDFKSAKLLGSSKWCVSKQLKYWNLYTKNKNSFFFYFPIDSDNDVCLPFGILSNKRKIIQISDFNNLNTAIDLEAIKLLLEHNNFNYEPEIVKKSYLNTNFIFSFTGLFLLSAYHFLDTFFIVTQNIKLTFLFLFLSYVVLYILWSVNINENNNQHFYIYKRLNYYKALTSFSVFMFFINMFFIL